MRLSASAILAFPLVRLPTGLPGGGKRGLVHSGGEGSCEKAKKRFAVTATRKPGQQGAMRQETACSHIESKRERKRSQDSRG